MFTKVKVRDALSAGGKSFQGTLEMCQNALARHHNCNRQALCCAPGSLFSRDQSQKQPQEHSRDADRRFQLLNSYPNVLCTPHSAFLTHEALEQIAKVTVENLKQVSSGEECDNAVSA